MKIKYVVLVMLFTAVFSYLGGMYGGILTGREQQAIVDRQLFFPASELSIPTSPAPIPSSISAPDSLKDSGGDRVGKAVSGQTSGLEESLEYKLASINKGYPASKDDVTIARFRYLIDAIDAKTPESRQQVADMLVKAQQLLRDNHGKDVKLLELAESANTAIPDGADIRFAEVLAALIQMIR